MMRLCEMSIDELISFDYSCNCGRHHHMAIDHLAVGKGAVGKLPEFLADQKMKDGEPLKKTDKIYVVADVHTWQVGGQKVYDIVKEAGYPVINDLVHRMVKHVNG